jgi:threonine dehydrogenase-like Zn-dependent dehydrogenase
MPVPDNMISFILSFHSGTSFPPWMYTFAVLRDLIESGKLNVKVEKILPFTTEGLQEGFERLKSRRTVGKIAIDIFRTE